MESRDADFSALSEENGNEQRREGAEPSGDEQKLRNELEEYKDRYLRALAEVENVKKRAMKERSDILKYQGEKIVVDLLDVIDNLELALKHSEADPQKLKSGLEMVHKQFLDALGRWEIRPDSALGKQFDPTRFEALSKVPVDDAKPGTVINEFKKAYMYKDRLIRVGSGVVAGERPADADSTGEQQEE